VSWSRGQEPRQEWEQAMGPRSGSLGAGSMKSGSL